MSTEPHLPASERSPSPSPKANTGEFVLASSASPGRFVGRTVAAALAFFVLVTTGAFFFLFSRQGSSAVALAFSFAEGSTHRYRLHMRMNGTVSSWDSQTMHHGFAMDVTETLSWKVISIDDEGVVTLEVAIEDLSGTANGRPVPEPPKDATFQVRMAPDGRIVSGGILSSVSFGPGQGFAGIDQFSALLPDRPVAPGDTWTEDFECQITFAEGDLRYSTRNRFQRYEDIQGVRTAVISSQMIAPMDFTLDLRKFLKSLGQSPANSGLHPDARKIIYGGRGGKFETMSWIIPDEGVLMKSTSVGNFSVMMELVGTPGGQIPPGTSSSFGGDFRIELHRL